MYARLQSTKVGTEFIQQTFICGALTLCQTPRQVLEYRDKQKQKKRFAHSRTFHSTQSLHSGLDTGINDLERTAESV